MKIECSTHLTYCKSTQCFLTPINRTRTLLTVRCDLRKPLNIMANLAIEIKNSKNFYTVWFNQTVDYCENIGREKDSQDVVAFITRIIGEIDPKILQRCPIKGDWGTTNFTVDSSILDRFPLWVLPTTTVRVTYTAYTMEMDHIMHTRITWAIRRIGVDFTCGSYTCY